MCDEILLVASLALLAATFVPLERAFTARAQPHLRRELSLDLAFFALQYLAMSSALVGVNDLLQARLAWRWAPLQHFPLAAQVGISIVLGDLALYWGHRLCHAVPLLWRFHAVHHSVETLDWLAAHREHPLDGVFSQLMLNLPAALLGVDLTWMMPVLVLRGLWAVLIHSNVTLPLGPLGILLGDPVLHRWHHARVERTRHNFGNLAPYLDVLFGTHFRPGTEDYALGVPGQGPRTFLGLIAGPLIPAPTVGDDVGSRYPVLEEGRDGWQSSHSGAATVERRPRAGEMSETGSETATQREDSGLPQRHHFANDAWHELRGWVTATPSSRKMPLQLLASASTTESGTNGASCNTRRGRRGASCTRLS